MAIIAYFGIAVNRIETVKWLSTISHQLESRDSESASTGVYWDLEIRPIKELFDV